MTKGFSIYFALCIKNRMFYVLNDLEKPRDFDPFGQAGLSPLATI